MTVDRWEEDDIRRLPKGAPGGGRFKPFTDFAGRLGQSYDLAGQVVSGTLDGSVLVHGTIEGVGFPRHPYAWVQRPDGSVYDGVFRQTFDGTAYQALFSPIPERRYTADEARANALRTGNWGPWDDEVKGASVAEATGGRVTSGRHGNQGNIKPIMRWFEHGEGAAKIRWGTKGDFMRCVHIAEKHMTPENARGFCNRRHMQVLGHPPGQGPHLGVPKIHKKGLGMDETPEEAEAALAADLGLDDEPEPVAIGDVERKAIELLMGAFDDDVEFKAADYVDCLACGGALDDAAVCTECKAVFDEKGLRKWIERLHPRKKGKFAKKGGGDVPNAPKPTRGWSAGPGRNGVPMPDYNDSWIKTIDTLADMAADRDSLLHYMVDMGIARAAEGKKPDDYRVGFKLGPFGGKGRFGRMPKAVIGMRNLKRRGMPNGSEVEYDADEGVIRARYRGKSDFSKDFPWDTKSRTIHTWLKSWEKEERKRDALRNRNAKQRAASAAKRGVRSGAPIDTTARPSTPRRAIGSGTKSLVLTEADVEFLRARTAAIREHSA